MVPKNINNALKRPISTLPYIGLQLAPVLMLAAKSGDINPERWISGGSAQTGRASNGSITKDSTTADPISYTLGEIRKTKQIDERDEANFGGYDAAAIARATACQRVVYEGIDGAVSAAFLAKAAHAALQNETFGAHIVRAVMDLRSKTAAEVKVIMTAGAWLKIVDLSSIVNLCEKVSKVKINISDPKQLNAAEMETFASACFGAGFIQAGNAWDSTSVYVMAMPTPGASCFEEAQAAATLMQDIDGVEPHDGVCLQEWHDDDTDSNIVSAKANVQAKIINGDLLHRIVIPASEA